MVETGGFGPAFRIQIDMVVVLFVILIENKFMNGSGVHYFNFYFGLMMWALSRCHCRQVAWQKYLS